MAPIKKKTDKVVNNPYRVKRCAMKLPVEAAATYGNKVETVATMVDNVFVTFATRRKDGVASYVKPVEEHFKAHSVDQGLIEKWKVCGIMPRRDPTCLEENKKLPGAPDKGWGWDAFLTVGNDEDTPQSVGTHITGVLNEFIGNPTKMMNKNPFNFHRVASNENKLQPLAFYLLNEDVMEVLKRLYDGNPKEAMMAEDELLEQFFLSAEEGRELLKREVWE
jgi:hypothetical protein